MEIIIDNEIVNVLINDPNKLLTLLGKEDRISFKWPSLLKHIGYGSLFSELPTFDETTPLFIASISTLSTTKEKEVAFYIYDHLFAEALAQIKALPQINAQSLIQAIQEQRKKSDFSKIEKSVASTLMNYEIALSEATSQTMHDLILYLGWDRMCVWIGQLFNYQSEDPQLITALATLRECLVESYQHITQQGRTSPGFYRMMESLLFYEMREENMENHTDEEWALLSQNLPLIKDPNDFVDLFYIDDGIGSEANDSVYFTHEPSEIIDTRRALTHHITNKLKKEVAGWDYGFHPKKTSTLN